MAASRLTGHLEGVRGSYRCAARGEEAGDLSPRLREALEILRREEMPSCTAGSPAVREHLAPEAGQRLLDVGCGADLIVHRFDRWPSIFYGVDVCEEPLAETQRFAVERAVSLGGLALAHAAALPFDNRSFDLLICIGVLEYGPLIYVRQAMKEMARVLRPGGRAVVDFPNAAHERIGTVCEIEAARGRPIHVPRPDEVLASARRHFAIAGADVSRVMERLCLSKPEAPARR